MANNALADAARERAAAAERATRAKCRKLRFTRTQASQIEYIESQIDLGTREEDDITLLKTRRKQIMAEAERRTR